ncbi:MAG: PEGA domain-containing protein [Acidobacteria bacterium]|nr:PEGA domain-containing protein [Acidobacteriota bacterium]
MRPSLAWTLAVCAWAQTPTAVYTLADHHTTRWTGERDPVAKIAGVCAITTNTPVPGLICSRPPVSEPRTGRRHFYSVVLFRDLDETLYLAACSSLFRESMCDLLRAGQTFSAEVEEQTIRVVIRDEQLPLRILDRRPKPITVDSPAKGAPSNVKPSTGTPSVISHSRVSETKGTPSVIRPSDVSAAVAAPSSAAPSQASTAVASSTGARLYVYSSNGAARVFLDDQFVGRSPVDVPVVPGRHTIVVRAPGLPDWMQQVDTPAGRTTRITAEPKR